MPSNKLNTYKSLWITWNETTRTENLARELNTPVYAKQIEGAFRHLLSPLWTAWVLMRKQPRIIYLHYSYLLLIVIGIYKILKRNRVVIVNDCHTKALRRKLEGALSGLFESLKSFSFNKCDICIIHNKGMEADIIPYHSNYIILPDKIPEYSYKNHSHSNTYCVYASSFDKDEPIEEIFEVANLLKDEIDIYWTGKAGAYVKKKAKKYSNLHITGFIGFQSYIDLIGNADCVLALTREEGCLQSAAYEAMNVETPLVLSDTEALRSYFDGAAEYAKINPEDIADKIRTVMGKKEDVISQIRKLKKQRNREFEERFNKLEALIAETAERRLPK